MTSNLQRLIQLGFLLLLGLMPFHAFFSVWLGSLTGHRSLIQSWKELLLVVLAALTLWLVIREPQRWRRLRQPGLLMLMAFAGVAVTVTLLNRPPLVTTAFGFKTDLEFIGAALVAVLAGSAALVGRAVRVSLLAAAGVVVFGLAQIFFLPPDLLTHFGYGPDTIVPYQTLGSGLSDVRFASTLGGPNQLGAYLTIVIALGLAVAWRWARWRWWLLGLVAASTIVLIHTYSRAAWIGAALAASMVILGLLRDRWRVAALASGGVLLIAGVLAWPALTTSEPLQHYFRHGETDFSQQRGSDFEHLASLQTGVQAVTAEPLGHGLGTAGPTVFHTGMGRIIENYYLQLGYEAGVLGMLLFIAALALIIWRLLRPGVPQPLGLAAAAAVSGVSVNALVLPAWTDSTTALIAWTLVGLCYSQLRPQQESRHV